MKMVAQSIPVLWNQKYRTLASAHISQQGKESTAGISLAVFRTQTNVENDKGFMLQTALSTWQVKIVTQSF